MRVAEPVYRGNAGEAQQIVDDAERRDGGTSARSAPTTTGLISSGHEQDQVIDVLDALDCVQHQRDEEAEHELQQHDGRRRT